MTVECAIKCLQGRDVIKTHGLHIYLYTTFSIKYPVTKVIVLRGPVEGILAAAFQKLQCDVFSGVANTQRSQEFEGRGLCLASAKVTVLFRPRTSAQGFTA